MSQQTMPVAKKILAPDVSISMMDQIWLDKVGVSKVRDAVKSSVRLDANIASDLYWRGEQHYYRIDNDFGPLILPFDSMWMEWETPEEVNFHGKPMKRPTRYHEAAMLNQHDAEGGRVLTAQLFVYVPAASRLMCSGVVIIWTDNSGRYIEHKIAYPESVNPDLAEELTADLNVAYMAINLMNCKNVEISDGGAVRIQRSGRAKKKRVPALKFKTILLPGSSSSPGGKTNTVTEAEMARHRVRGHFKTFTKEKPLFGKLTGTYWWGWQVRGNAANGINVNDYSLDGFEVSA